MTPSNSFIAIVSGGACGLLTGAVIFTVYRLRGSPGETGLEILVVAFTTIQGAVAGIGVAIASFFFPRPRTLQWASVVLLSSIALVVQTVLSFAAKLLASAAFVSDGPAMIATGVMSVSPINWATMKMNVSWWYATIPTTVLVAWIVLRRMSKDEEAFETIANE